MAGLEATTQPAAELPAYEAQLRADLRGPDLPASLNELAVGYRSAAQELATLKAQPTLRVPGADAKPEEIQAYHKAIGVPDNPDGYGIKPPEGVPEAEVKAFVTAAHKKGYTKGQIEEALTFYQGSIKRALESYGKTRSEQATAILGSLKTELVGGDETKFTALCNQVDRVLELNGGAELKDELKNASKDSPRLFKFLATKIVPLFKEDGSPIGNTTGGIAATAGEPSKEELRKTYNRSPGMAGT